VLMIARVDGRSRAADGVLECGDRLTVPTAGARWRTERDVDRVQPVLTATRSGDCPRARDRFEDGFRSSWGKSPVSCAKDDGYRKEAVPVGRDGLSLQTSGQICMPDRGLFVARGNPCSPCGRVWPRGLKIGQGFGRGTDIGPQSSRPVRPTGIVGLFFGYGPGEGAKLS